MSFDPAFFLIFPVFVLSIVVHECAHGLAALACGDPTARDRGRLTLNPLPHVDPVGSLLIPGVLLLTHSPFLFGWAKPVPVDWANLKNPRNDPVKVALAGPVSNLLLAVAFAVVVRLAPSGDAPGRGWTSFLAPLAVMGYAGVVMNCALALFNLIPVPPLDGSWVLMRFLPLRHIIALRRFRMLGLALLLVLFSAPRVADAVFYRPVSACLGPFGVAGQGLAL